MRGIRLPGAGLPCVLLLACGGGGPAEDGGRAVDRPPGAAPIVMVSPPETGDGWQSSTPAAEQMDEARLFGILEELRVEGSDGIDGVVVVRNDRLVAEAYYNGYDRDTLHDVRSVTKSITSALAGIAIDRGLFGLDDTIDQLIPNFEDYDVTDDRKRAIRVRDLLNMQTGMKCDDATESSPGNESRMYRRSDWVEFALEIPMAGEPGRDMSYCSAGVMLLGHIIAARAQMKLEEFAAMHLLGPLGIVNVRWLHSPMGVTNANSTFQIRPRDMAKFGRLYLDAGAWHGAPVVPAAWVELSYTSSGLMRGGSPYGWLWWKGEFRVGTQMREVLFAAGNGGNHIFVMPTERLVVVITASNYDRQGPSFALMRDLIAHTVQ